MRRLNDNNLGPEAGMALAEALKSNTTLKELLSAALPSNPPARASRPFTALYVSVCVTPFLYLRRISTAAPRAPQMRPAIP